MRARIVLESDMDQHLFNGLKMNEGESDVVVRLPGPVRLVSVREAPRGSWQTPGHMLFRSMTGHSGRCECGTVMPRGMYPSDVLIAHEKHVAEVVD